MGEKFSPACNVAILRDAGRKPSQTQSAGEKRGDLTAFGCTTTERASRTDEPLPVPPRPFAAGNGVRHVYAPGETNHIL